MVEERELVKKTLEFENKSGRVPRHLWSLPWASYHYPKQLKKIQADFPDDIVVCPTIYSKPLKTQGDPYALGNYTDEWGCVFQNLQPGIIGEVKEPIICADDENWEDLTRVHVPEEELSFCVEEANAFCRSTSKFVMGGCFPRPFERLQFLRGSAQLFMDLILRPAGMISFIEKMHSFYCDLMEKWAETEVDALQFMDDWGSQNSTLISPDIWRELFMPMYKDYVDIAHRKGKKIFMHSDGHILSIYPHLVDIGIDALNSQIFCMGVDSLKPYRGKITFWGEIDRQHLLPEGTTDDIYQAVKHVYETLWEDGGCIAQCEFGPGAKPENVYEVFSSWSEMKK